MPETPEFAEVRAAWRDQPAGPETPFDVRSLQGRRMSEMSLSTRSEILGSASAALLFALVVALRFAPERGWTVYAGCAVVGAWAALTLWRFRVGIWSPAAPGQGSEADAFAQTGIKHYRAELARRRDHLRSAWIWHGPLLLACAVAALILGGRMPAARVWTLTPFVLLLALSAAIGFRRRLMHAAALQREMDEIDEAIAPQSR